MCVCVGCRWSPLHVPLPFSSVCDVAIVVAMLSMTLLLMFHLAKCPSSLEVRTWDSSLSNSTGKCSPRHLLETKPKFVKDQCDQIGLFL